MLCKFVCTSLFFVFLFKISFAQKVAIEKAFDHAARQTKVMLDELEKSKDPLKPDLLFPRTVESGKLKLVGSGDWTSGFFPGVLWYLYDFTKEESWKNQAVKYTSLVEKEKTNKSTHDIGFMIYCSVGTGFKLTGDKRYEAVIIEAAKSLASRFNSKTGTILSWDHSRHVWKYPVIIDNMMNLELLFAATKLTGDSSFYQIAVSHANATMENHFRPDFSSFHVVDYDPATGAVLNRHTHQGYSHGSAWARGQAWALYGYSLCYRETKDERYLRQAENIAKFLLEHANMPNDMIPYYDFDAPGIPKEPRDASAAAIIASALYELSNYSRNAKVFRAAADKMMRSLSTSYISPTGENKGFILLHSTGSKPANSEVDVPLNYADYYYLEALLRRKLL